MGAKAYFRVVARLDGPLPIPGTVIVDRTVGLFAVRPLRRHRTYELPLSTVADMVVARVIRAEVLARRLAKKRSG